MTRTHIAVALDDALDVRVSVEWCANVNGVDVTLRDYSGEDVYGHARIPWFRLGHETPDERTLDTAVALAFAHKGMKGFEVDGDTVALAAHYSVMHGFKWLPEKLAQ